MVPSKIFPLVAVALGFGCDIASVCGQELLRRSGQHIRLTTDLPSVEQADTIVATFDAAVEQWVQFWEVPEQSVDGWLVEAFVMSDKDRFERERLIPAAVPDFPFGYTLKDRIWIRTQKSEYYTRHLVLHEGVHALAYQLFEGTGSTWFQEGTAEMLATHRGNRDDVRTNVVPANRQEVPYWGRFKRMQQSRQDGTVPTVSAVMRYRPNLLGDVESYGWSWAASMMFAEYPEYRPTFMASARDGRLRGPRFNQRFRQPLIEQWPILEARWRIMCHDLDYGFDWSREQVNLSINDPKWDGRPIQTKVVANQGWQSIGVRVPGNVTLSLSATGQVTLADQPKPWLSEPPGITFQYHRGRPIGQLLVAVLPNAIDAEATTVDPLEVHAVGYQTKLNIEDYSWLLFRVNDAVGSLDDNQGEYQVVIQR